MGQPAGQRAEGLELPRLAQLALHALADLAVFHLLKRPGNGGDEPGEARFENVIGGAFVQRLDRDFLADRARDEDEGQLRPLGVGDAQCFESVELRQGAVGQDEVALPGLQGLLQLGLGFDPGHIAGPAGPFQHGHDQLAVQCGILDMNNLKRRTHHNPRYLVISDGTRTALEKKAINISPYCLIRVMHLVGLVDASGQTARVGAAMWFNDRL